MAWASVGTVLFHHSPTSKKSNLLSLSRITLTNILLYDIVLLSDIVDKGILYAKLAKFYLGVKIHTVEKLLFFFRLKIEHNHSF